MNSVTSASEAPGPVWFKSSYSSSGDGNDCVEVAITPATIHIRDSKRPTAPASPSNRRRGRRSWPGRARSVLGFDLRGHEEQPGRCRDEDSGQFFVTGEIGDGDGESAGCPEQLEGAPDQPSGAIRGRRVVRVRRLRQ